MLRTTSQSMPRIFLILILLSRGAFAESPKDQVKVKFTAELRSAVRSLLEAEIARNPEDPRAQQRRPTLAQQVEDMIPQAFDAFAPDLTVSDAEAAVLLKAGPNDVNNREEIQKNRTLMDQSPLPKPAIVTLMLKEADTDKSTSGWRLETLRRLTAGTVRQLKERGEPK
jgi:hypothetical protein